MKEYLERLANVWQWGYCGDYADWFGGDTLEGIYKELREAQQ